MAKTKEKEEIHAHRYLRLKAGDNGYAVFKCVLPGCKRMIHPELSVGDVVECWRCGEAFQMNVKMAKFKKPHCGRCTRVRADKAA